MNRRVERVAELIKRETGKILIEDFKNLEVGFITVTDVEVTPDLKVARIFVSVLGPPEKQKQSLKILQESVPFFRREIGQRIQLRFVPEVRFEYDPTGEKAVRVFELLDKIKKEEEKNAAKSDQGNTGDHKE